MKIDKFRGKYYFLSNFYHAPVHFQGITYQNNEAAFQSAKIRQGTTVTVNNHQITRQSFSSLTPNIAKRLGRKIPLRSDWEQIKVKVMVTLVIDKFSNPELKKKLLATGDSELIEGNTWNDTTWGRCNNIGKNYLGKILMNVRDYYK